MPRVSYPQGRYWMLTLPSYSFVPYLPPPCCWIRGQLETAASGYLHWQVVVCFKRKIRAQGVKTIFGDTAHVELSRSDAASQYVWKEETRVPTTQFELGQKPVNRSSSTDWDAIRRHAVNGNFEDIPSDVFIRCYHSLRKICTDNLRPVAVERTCLVYWGSTGTGKSRRAWTEAGMEAYPKTPTTKFWDGYRGEENVVIDEFRGAIEISHMLRWLDRYPVIVEIKGSATVLRAKRLWITSNLHPRDWYPSLDEETKNALLRRLEITHFQTLQ